MRLGYRYIFYFNSTDYLIWDSSRKQCIFSFIKDTDSKTKFWLMGDPFMRAFYVVHDQES